MLIKPLTAVQLSLYAHSASIQLASPPYAHRETGAINFPKEDWLSLGGGRFCDPLHGFLFTMRAYGAHLERKGQRRREGPLFVARLIEDDLISRKNCINFEGYSFTVEFIEIYQDPKNLMTWKFWYIFAVHDSGTQNWHCNWQWLTHLSIRKSTKHLTKNVVLETSDS